MIGDNQHSDIDMARQQGINAIHVENPAQRQYYENWSQPEQHDNGVFQAVIAAEEKLPFKELAFSLWSLYLPAFQQACGREYKARFLALQGRGILQKLFDRFQTDLFGCRPITSHYLLVSRKATFLASLRPLGEEDFARLFNHYRDISCRDFLLSLNFEELLAAEDLPRGRCRFCRPAYRPAKSGRIPKTYDIHRCFSRSMSDRRIQQKENFIQYLDSFGVDYKKKD